MLINEITQQYLHDNFAYEPSTGIIKRKNGRPFGCKNFGGYIIAGIGGRRGIEIYAHRLIWLYVTGLWPQRHIDHINGKRDDNRWENLREATPQQNQWNSKNRQPASGYRGVYWHPNKGKWQAKIKRDGKFRSLGYYTDPQDAAAAFQVARESLCLEWIRAS